MLKSREVFSLKTLLARPYTLMLGAKLNLILTHITFLHRGTDIAALHLRALSNYAKHNYLLFASICVDAAAAFESVTTALEFGDKFADEAIALIFKRLNFGPSLLHQIVAVCKNPDAFEKAKVPFDLAKLGESLHDGPWFSTNGLAPVAVTQQGSRPGDPLGDLVFVFLMVCILVVCRARVYGVLVSHSTPTLEFD